MNPALFPLFSTAVLLGFSATAEAEVVSHLPESGLGQLIVDRLDISTFRNSLGPRRSPGQRHFADVGLKPVSVTDTLVDLSEPDWKHTIRIAERRDVNGDGLEDLVLVWADHSSSSSYIGADTLLVTRYAADGDLIALAFTPTPAAPAGPAGPPSGSPEAAAVEVVAELYKAHAAGSGPFFQNKDRARLDQVFARPFADLIWKDANQPDGEGGAISADPLIDAQDGEPARLSFAADPPKDGKVLVTASMSVLGKPRLIRFRMVEESGTWKVADILGHQFTSLRETLDQAYSPAAPRQR